MLEMIMPIIVIAILGFGMLWGFIRKLNKTLLRFVFLLLALGGAFLLSKMFSGMMSDYVFELLKSANIEGLSELFENEEATELVSAFCRMLAQPVLFVLFYLVLKPISWIPYKIVSVIFRVKGPRLFGRLTGAVAGLLCGLVGLVVFVTPVFGYMHLVDDAVKLLVPEEEIDESFTFVMEMTQTPVAAQAYDMVGKHFFTGLTTTTLGEDKISLAGELGAVLSVVEDAMVLVEKSPEEYGPAEGAAMEKLAHDVGSSHILSSLLSSLLSEAANSWLNGEQAFGMEKPEMGTDMQGIMDAFFQVFSTSNAENIEADLTTFTDVFGIFIEKEMLALLEDENGADAFVEKLVSDGVVGELYTVLEENPRMAPVKAAIIDTGMRLMLEQLGVSDQLQENHGELMENIVNVAQDAVKEDGTLDADVLTDGLQNALQENEIEVSDEVVQIVADGIADTFTAEELEDLTVDELVDKLIDRFASAELPEQIPENWQDMIPQN